MQVLNVALGGTLYQDLPSQWEWDVLKHRQDTPKWQPTHEVRVVEGSYIAEAMGREVVKVNSYHHQGIRTLAEGLVIAGRSSDGVIEAVEAVDVSERWLLGVQWHAEAMRGAGPQQESLFEAHVSAAERHALRRAAA
jgi:putative glutamine amidotransferase